MSSTDVATSGNEWTTNEEALSGLAGLGARSEQSFAELAGQSAVTDGRALRDKESLLTVPHIITKVTFNQGDYKADPTDKIAKLKGRMADFVSLEATDINDMAIVYNDGSTGVRRQVVMFLQAAGAIPADRDPDWPVTEADGQAVTFELGKEGVPTFACVRGLRKSDYTNEHGPATTYYLG